MARFRLGQWHVDPATGVLSDGARSERLTPKVMDLLLALMSRHGQVMSREELLHAVWGERAVTDEPLTRAIAELRRALGDERASPAYIETIPKRGYRLVAAVGPAAAQTEPARSADPAAAPPRDGVAVAPQRLPQAPPGRRNVWLAGVAAVAAAVSLVWFALSRPPAAGVPLSVAVMPLADLNGREDMQYFADGVHDEIIARLAQLPELTVASRSAVTSLARVLDTPEAIAARLGVESMILGTTLHSGGRVRVNVQHVAAGSDAVLWARSFERPLSVGNLFAIQAEIAEAVASGLSFNASFAGDSGVLPTASWEAYEAFLLGKYHYRRRQSGDMRLAVDYLQASVDADPGFAQAWDWLAYAWNHAGVVEGWTVPREAFPKARAAAARALELDPKNATARALLGYLRAVFDRDWELSLIELTRAVEAAPRESGTVWSKAYVLSLTGRYDEAIDMTRELARMYAGQGRYALETGWRLLDAGRFSAAADAAQSALEDGAEPGLVHELLGIAAYAGGDLETAMAQLERAVDLQRRAPGVLARLAAVMASRGMRDEAERLVAEILRAGDGETADPVNLAIVLTAQGRKDAALEQLELAETQRRRGVLEIRHNPFFAALREDPRFAAILARTGLDG